MRIRHRKYEKLMVDYLMNELSASEVEKLKEHIKNCKNCRENFAEYKSVLTRVKELESPVYNQEFWTAKLSEVKNYQPQRHKRSFLEFAIASVSVAVVFVVLFVFARGFKPEENRMVKTSPRDKYTIILSGLPYPEDTLLEMVDYIDDDSAEKLLSIIFENTFR